MLSLYFHIFTQRLKQCFHTIKSLYTDGGTEYIKLKPYLNTHGISHYISPPYTPKHIGTALTLMSHSNVPQIFWCYAFQTAVYLINRMPTTHLKNKYPCGILFGSAPNYLNLRVFGCLCYPWLRPYSQNKLSNRSMPCVFLGYNIMPTNVIIHPLKSCISQDMSSSMTHSFHF